MKCLYSSRRSDATSSLIHSSPLIHTLITFNAETVKQILLAEDSSVVHARPYSVVFDLVKRYHVALGNSQVSLVWSDEAIFDAVVSRGSRLDSLSDSSKQKCVSEQRNKHRLSI